MFVGYLNLGLFDLTLTLVRVLSFLFYQTISRISNHSSIDDDLRESLCLFDVLYALRYTTLLFLHLFCTGARDFDSVLFLSSVCDFVLRRRLLDFFSD